MCISRCLGRFSDVPSRARLEIDFCGIKVKSTQIAPSPAKANGNHQIHKNDIAAFSIV